MTWVSKEAVWSPLVHLIGLGRCFPAKIEPILKISQKTVAFHWILMIFVGFLNVIPFWLKNSGPNKQIIVPWPCPLLWTPWHPPGWYNSGEKEISAWNPSVDDLIFIRHTLCLICDSAKKKFFFPNLNRTTSGNSHF